MPTLCSTTGAPQLSHSTTPLYSWLPHGFYVAVLPRVEHVIVDLPRGTVFVLVKKKPHVKMRFTGNKAYFN